MNSRINSVSFRLNLNTLWQSCPNISFFSKSVRLTILLNSFLNSFLIVWGFELVNYIVFSYNSFMSLNLFVYEYKNKSYLLDETQLKCGNAWNYNYYYNYISFLTILPKFTFNLGKISFKTPFEWSWPHMFLESNSLEENSYGISEFYKLNDSIYSRIFYKSTFNTLSFINFKTLYRVSFFKVFSIFILNFFINKLSLNKVLIYFTKISFFYKFYLNLYIDNKLDNLKDKLTSSNLLLSYKVNKINKSYGFDVKLNNYNLLRLQKFFLWLYIYKLNTKIYFITNFLIFRLSKNYKLIYLLKFIYYYNKFSYKYFIVRYISITWFILKKVSNNFFRSFNFKFLVHWQIYNNKNYLACNKVMMGNIYNKGIIFYKAYLFSCLSNNFLNKLNLENILFNTLLNRHFYFKNQFKTIKIKQKYLNYYLVRSLINFNYTFISFKNNFKAWYFYKYITFFMELLLFNIFSILFNINIYYSLRILNKFISFERKLLLVFFLEKKIYNIKILNRFKTFYFHTLNILVLSLFFKTSFLLGKFLKRELSRRSKSHWHIVRMLKSCLNYLNFHSIKFLGLYIQISGKLQGRGRRSRVISMYKKSLPNFQRINLYSVYSYHSVITIYSNLGLKIWIYY